jgi:hypothetical protein
VSSLAGTVLGGRQEERGAEFERAGNLGLRMRPVRKTSCASA